MLGITSDSSMAYSSQRDNQQKLPFLETNNQAKKHKLKIKLPKSPEKTPQPSNKTNRLSSTIVKNRACSDKSIDLSKINAQCSPQSRNTKEQIFVCCLAFRTTETCKLNLSFTDRVKLICDKGEYCLVQNIITGDTGFVPRICITSLAQFINDIKYLNA